MPILSWRRTFKTILPDEAISSAFSGRKYIGFRFGYSSITARPSTIMVSVIPADLAEHQRKWILAFSVRHPRSVP